MKKLIYRIVQRTCGRDTSDNSKSSTNILRFGEGFSASDVTLRLGSLIPHSLTLAEDKNLFEVLDLGNGDQIHINNEDQTNANGFDRNDVFNSSPISSFEFADGSVLSSIELLARGFDLAGAANDSSYIQRRAA